MHYEVNYKDHKDTTAADTAALKDICEWMGEERFTRVDDLYRQMLPVSLELFRLQMSFVGVQGYPVEAWHRSLWPGESRLN
jgi:hypothetical protein